MKLIVLVVIAAWFLGPDSGLAASKAERKQEIAALRKELRFLDLRAREDLRAAGPASAAGAATELENGRVYVQADAGLVFEKLGLVRVDKLVLRKGHRLLVRLRPPSDIRPALTRMVAEDGGWAEPPAWEVLKAGGAERGRALATDVDLEDYSSVRQALGTLLFLPGQSPTEEERAACLQRYPDHDEEMSRMRCGAAE